VYYTSPVICDNLQQFDAFNKLSAFDESVKPIVCGVLDRLNDEITAGGLTDQVVDLPAGL
jgi:hypothetical protein